MASQGLRIVRNPPEVVGNRSNFAEKVSGELRLAMGLEVILGICELLEHTEATPSRAANRLSVRQTS